jgi:uncharacterized membrane protein (DUF485 family)
MNGALVSQVVWWAFIIAILLLLAGWVVSRIKTFIK